MAKELDEVDVRDRLIADVTALLQQAAVGDLRLVLTILRLAVSARAAEEKAQV